MTAFLLSIFVTCCIAIILSCVALEKISLLIRVYRKVAVEQQESINALGEWLAIHRTRIDDIDEKISRLSRLRGADISDSSKAAV